MTSPRRNDEQTTTIGARKARRTLNNTSSQPPCVICEETNNKRHAHCHLRRNKVTSSSTIHDDAARTSLYKKGLSQASCVRLACSVATCLYIYSLLSPLSTGNAAYVSDDHLLRAFLTFFLVCFCSNVARTYQTCATSRQIGTKPTILSQAVVHQSSHPRRLSYLPLFSF